MDRESNKQKILVTGGAGFIGGHLVDRLLSLDYSVVVLDSLALPTHDGVLPAWFPAGAEFIQGDVRKKEDWVKALKGVDIVYHLAGYMDFLPDYSTYYDVNSSSAALLYEVIHENNFPIKKIIGASSQAVYGEGKYYCDSCGIVYPLPRIKEMLDAGNWDVVCPKCGKKAQSMIEDENDFTIQNNPYSISKRSMEQTMIFLGNHLTIPSYALRYTIVHGPRQSIRHFYSGALRQFVSMALAGLPISMHEDGKQLRDFVHISDVIDAHMLLLERNDVPSGIYNIGSGRANTVYELAETVVKNLGIEFSPLLKGQYRVGNARNSVADVSKLKKIGWSPRKTLDDNVKDYIIWVKSDSQVENNLKKGAEKIEIQDPVRKIN